MRRLAALFQRSLASRLSCERRQRLLNDAAPHRLFIISIKRRIAKGIDDTLALHHSVGSNHLGDRRDRCDLRHRNSRALQLRRYRSSAASAGASSGSQDNGVNAGVFERLRDFSSNTPTIGYGIRQSGH